MKLFSFKLRVRVVLPMLRRHRDDLGLSGPLVGLLSKCRDLGPLASVVIYACATAVVAQQTDEISGTIDPSKWQERATLTGDWNGKRQALQDMGFTINSTLSQFYQGQVSGSGDNGWKYGGKLDFQVRTDLEKLGFWEGSSFTIKAEYNFGSSLNGAGGTIAPINTALYFPGIDGSDGFDVSNFFFGQKINESTSLVVGKMNMIDFASSKPFMGGAGIDSFWNITFTAPPSGLVPPYMFGGILSVKTEKASYGLWIYDPNDVVNRSGLEDPFSDGVTVRANVEIPVSIGGLKGHQGLTALYSTYPGTNLETPGLELPELPSGTPNTKDERYYFAYSFDQKLFERGGSSKEGIGIFGQFGISDGNPTRLYWSALAGISGRGMIPGRSDDNWGLAYYYDTISQHLIDAVAPTITITNESGVEIFYNWSIAPSVTLGADLQIVRPGLSAEDDVFLGVRLVTRF